MIPFIDLHTQQQRVKPQIDAAIQRVLAHGKYIMGPEVAQLEEQLANYVGVRHCITVSSGTDSLLIALLALGIGPGDEVITVPYTWIATAEVIALVGAKPVFVDIKPDTWNMDAERLESAITARTKAIIPVGIYGQTSDMTAINEIAARRGEISVIEDAAQSFGATHHQARSCGLSLIGSTSFFPTKPLGCYGDGGALFTGDDDLGQRMRQIRVHGQQRKHHHPILGLNGRLDTLQAAILLEKLAIFDQECSLRANVADNYSKLIRETPIPCLHLPCTANGNSHLFAQYTILVENRDELRRRMLDLGIPTVAYYSVPLHQQPVFSDLGHKEGDFPVAEEIARHCLSLPMSPYLTIEIQQQIITNLVKAICAPRSLAS